ncbi:L-aminoadipate-semialdehyde dehydrogenase [Spizellomyces punctatus DAOM BR117]|uniref:Alpha-aminoadipate reductase n=1 Tax=Spizellomyces punctatus (strain DAOM BR117) TaxID=645134 RepID=A0A0L0HF16_SPIPD|nr:L-aminoadipate-semialdehyde dehydrogenase [Spizellomyces punctatus DAOM BR117]KNC99692.1 L-aminoadipate-semialdehyde dehydrogenase [Spizellomyces punctatus DAOM BR117]|eukprot:XP_016607732.1 L-aminoadipate-semialdehyde dehydrogenase [Spizellomyces punctatus DAOM BR117]
MGATLPDEPVSPTLISRWKERLSSLTELVLPTDYPRPIPHRIVEAEQVLQVPEAISLAILKLSLNIKPNYGAVSEEHAAHGSSSTISPFTILLAAFSILLHKYTGEEDITVGSSSRSSNPLVLRFPLTDNDTIATAVQTVLKAEEDALADEIPFAALLNDLLAPSSVRPESGQQQSLFKVRFFNLTDTTPDTLSSTTTSSTCDITIFISQAPTLRRLLPIEIRVVYNTVLFSNSRITDMLDQLQLVLQSAAEDPQATIGRISLLTARSRTLLPDPTADLEWDRFEGAITDIFARNAKSHPDRTCVVESREAQGSTFGDLREFSFKQINEASNVLAHHLIANGIEREDVVVLYSYRGVDLVVAVMGVLKAGAIFSVIDPAYPPSRQNIYLSVAKPRGLVILRKAGELHEDVRGYIKDNLDIKCEVPALEILDDGLLVGGSSTGTDVLAPHQNNASIEPAVVLGPDSGCTLSFTSGSTGIPKGVKGRHFSLTHFYPWMRHEFGLTEHERFTMLSGIAHDPIQRDIFTPLFLGAQLRIPTAEDIGTPGRLAEWMAHHGITVTHLTPAMGQLLSANATHPIPTLRNAFFVGDVLTKRDVLRLQYLAPNTHVINMYGTTETQRAVSYLDIPPTSLNPGFLSEQKDIMPAGKGMKNVQLLVVNNSGLLCGIGEVGEIYVRSGGLAEGYLDLEASAQKFVPNPFNPSGPEPDRNLPYYKGPRDRMYRSGDLGRYRPDGSVECTGRADDQVKIRGFRIELKEIDTHLSQHSNVRENVTLVRRDKDEEKTLVSYIVPLDADVDVAAFIKDVREYLKTKLPGYAVPKVIFPLKRMPLTPNGKVDKNALPFPDTALTAAAPATGEDNILTPIQLGIRDIWSNVLGRPSTSIPIDDNFFDLGGHSILATRLVFEVRKTLAVEVPLSIVYREPTVRGMAKEVDFIRGGDLRMIGNESGKTERGAGEQVAVEEEEEVDYAADLDALDDPAISATGLPQFDFPIKEGLPVGRPVFFLTGATGFLGAFILGALLRRFPNSRVIALVRAKTPQDALARIRDNGERHLVWEDQWLTADRVEAICGDLALSRLGVSEEQWEYLSTDVDVIVHNGALVHWVYPYHKLRAPNVLGTLESLRLATRHHLKPLHFVSSTAVLDTEHYMRKLELGEKGKVLETDDLEGSRKGLRSGYGQTKWVSEKLIMIARERGVPATIIRPGYIVGDSTTGVGNTDDFLWRLVKGCIQLGKVPRIANLVNMCPVDYVAGAIAEVASTPTSLALGVFHMHNSDRFKYDDMFGHLVRKGYTLVPVDYIHWRTALMDLTLSTADNALYPLLHFVLDDLPTSTKSAELDDSHVKQVLEERPGGVVCKSMNELMGLYLGYFVEIGFLEKPPIGGEPMMRLDAWQGLKGSVGRTRG